MSQYPPPLHAVYVYTVLDTYSQRERGREGGGELTREKVRGATLHTVGWKIPK